MSSWFDDDTFWESLDWFLFSEFRTAETTSIEADQIIKLLRPVPSSSILDLCCGPGRHCLEFARRGFCVTGVDRTARYLELARARSAEQRLDIEFLQADMRTFKRAEHFDVALNLFSSFGYFEDPNDDLQVLRNLQESLKPGGKLLMEMLGKEPLARNSATGYGITVQVPRSICFRKSPYAVVGTGSKTVGHWFEAETIERSLRNPCLLRGRTRKRFATGRLFACRSVRQSRRHAVRSNSATAGSRCCAVVLNRYLPRPGLRER